MFASALAPPLRERFPRASLDLWCKAYTADIAQLVPGVTRVIASDPFWDRTPGMGTGGLVPFVRALRDIRRARYHLAVLASSQWRVAAALALVRVPERIGRKRRRNARWLTRVLPEESRSRPVVIELGGIVQALGATPRAHYELDRAPLEARRASFAQVLGVGHRVALHAFAGSRARCVPISEWRTLGHALVHRGVGVVWIGSRAELAEVRSGGVQPEWTFADSFGSSSLIDAAALISLCGAFVGHDSGPMHIAGGLGVPALGIFAPGEPERTFPQGVGASRVIARPSPAGITAETMLRELDLLTHLEPRPRAHR
ncbi:MAG: glycosyltransferase family 9 protein [Gemmatimonadaceae bacterium]